MKKDGKQGREHLLSRPKADGNSSSASPSASKEVVAAVWATLNHEINSPLTTILGNAQLLKLSPLARDPEIRRKLIAIEREAVRIRNVVSRLPHLLCLSFQPYVGGELILDLKRSSYRGWVGDEDD